MQVLIFAGLILAAMLGAQILRQIRALPTNVLVTLFLVAAAALIAFAYWGQYTLAGLHAFDEMDGLYPFAAGILGTLLIAAAALTGWWGRHRRGRASRSDPPVSGALAEPRLAISNSEPGTWARDRVPTDYLEIIKHMSPDGRTVLALVPGYNPRDIHEMQILYWPKVIRDGVVILSLADEPVDTQFEWQPRGELKLILSSGLEILIDPINGISSTSHDGWLPHPIADTDNLVHKILNPNWGHDPIDFRRRWSGGKAILIALIFAAAVAGLLVEAWHGRFYKRGGRIDTGSEITGWSLNCADGRHIVLGLNDDGSLSFERSIVAEPLHPVDGFPKRFGNGRSTVEINGMNATIWFDGLNGQPLRCRAG